MTGGLGFTTMMKSILKNNRTSLRHNEAVRSKKDSLTYLKNRHDLRYKEVSEEELLKIKSRIRSEIRSERRRLLFRMLIVITGLIFMIGLLVLLLRPG